MIGALEGPPGVRVGLHSSGPLREWLLAERPRTIERLQALVARGQGEILGGGWTGPGLGGLPGGGRVPPPPPPGPGGGGAGGDPGRRRDRAGPGGVARARPDRPAAPYERGGGAHLRAAAARGGAGPARPGTPPARPP